MLNNRGDKFEGQDESEYHFSDEEVNYEVDSESSTEAPNESKQGLLNRFSRSKRMLIGLSIFIILVFVVYKIVTPTSPPVLTDVITPVTTQSKMPIQTSAPIQNEAKMQIVPPPVPGSAQSSVQPVTQMPSPASTVAPNVVPSAMTQEVVQPSQLQTMQQVVTPQQTMPPPVADQQPLPPQQMPTSSQSIQLSPSQLPPTISTVAQSSIPAQPPLISPVVTTPSSLPPPSTPTTSYPMGGQLTGIDAKIAVLEANNQKLVSQLQADYMQRLNDFYNQNKQLQDQIQGLATRVVNMESQLNQLVQTLTRQQTQSLDTPPPPGPQSQVVPKLPYNVQAIIPGRAWLRSDNGETVTVAEGDAIKDIGRVTKIDPYDGIVEINTGGKVVSLSYGNTG